MITSADQILFRCSSFGHLMTEPQSKSPADKYNEAVSKLAEATKKYADTFNKSTKTASELHAKILKLNTEILLLEKEKDEILLSDTCRKTLLRAYAEQVKGRREELKNKFLDKGNARENDSITL